MTKEIEWKERFNIGVENIDKAHQNLFSIVRKLIYLNQEEKKGQWACAEGIKYFKNYAVKHFAEEEAYMLSIHYPGYEIHKRLHDDLRYKTLPALDRDLVMSEYSPESIRHFLGICLGWLSGHILVEDRAITGNISAKWKKEQSVLNIETLETAIADTIEEIFKRQTNIVSEHYGGEDFGTCLIFRQTYQHRENKRLQVFFILEERLILQTVGAMLGINLSKIDKMVSEAGKELSQQVIQRIGLNFQSSGQYKPVDNHIITKEQLQQEFNLAYPDYGLLLDTGYGYFAFCIKAEV
ncbi:MAG: hemerythrin family protein [Eubacterium sp.]|nr:hemerythrin family protein [Eubacterium sp.]